VSRGAVKSPMPSARGGAVRDGPTEGRGRSGSGVAARVHSLQGPYGNAFVSRLLGGTPIQRKCGCGGSCCSSPAEDLGDIVQRKPAGGAPLPSSTRSAMESSFGRDFGGVRVHAGPQAEGLASNMNARAFTSGSNIYFGAGQYSPGTNAGRGLIAHELAHVVQQRAGRSPAGGIDTPGDVFEREADAAASSVLAGKRPQVSLLGGTPSVQRTNGAGPAVPTTIKKLAGGAVKGKLEIPGEKVISPTDRAELQKRYGAFADSGALRTKIHAGRGSTSTLWNMWKQSRPFKISDKDLKDKKGVCQPDHIIELQLGGADHPDNLRLLSGPRNQSVGSQLASNIKGFLIANSLAPDEVVELGKDQILVGPDGGGDPDCLGWERAKAGGKETEAAGADVINAKVGGLDVTIGWNPASKLVHPHSRYVVPLLRLNKVEQTGKSFQFEGEWSDRIETIPTSWRKPPNRKFQLTLAADGDELQFVDPADKLALQFPFLSEAQLPMRFEAGDLKASGSFRPTLPILKNVDITVAIEKERLSAGVAVPPEKLKSALPVPGLEITEANIQLSVANAKLKATGGFAFKYTTIADGKVTATADASGFVATGAVELHIPGLSEAKGEVWVREGRFGGQITIGADKLKFPGVKSARLVVRIEDGQLTGEGTIDLSVPGVKQAKLGFGVDDKGNYAITGEVLLAIPGTEDPRIGLTYNDGELEGFGRVGLKIPGLESAVIEIRYKKGALTGSGTVSYKKGKLAGTLTVNLSERGKLSGGGELSYEIAPGLVAFVGMQIREDGTTKISGGLRVPETIDIFPRKEVEKELFKLPTLEIPIFAIPLGTRSAGLVATIDARLVARAGVGPGQLRKVKILAEFDPSVEEGGFSFQASAELYVPASAELAVAIAAGLGLSVAIARAVGGIEAEGAAGIQAEFIAGTTLKYEAGKFAISGAAELSASPKLIFRLKAFVKVEIDVFVTTIEVYRKDWVLAQVEVGSALKIGVRVPFKYVFGEPFQLSLDQIEFIVPKIDPGSLVKELLPA
jgi:Domain of unknown function (DUF4157)